MTALAVETVRVRIDPEVSYQTIDGFGASDAWRCQFVGKNWPLEKRQRIADLLFSQQMDADGNPKGDRTLDLAVLPQRRNSRTGR